MRTVRATARTLTRKPGVYLFKDARGRVLYVGKAKSLRKRVLQYGNGRRLWQTKRDMVRRAERIETIVTHTEVEALALEASLIQRHQPPYNIQLLDDSSYLYVKITNEPYPKVSLTRHVLPDDAWYRGPFPSAQTIRRTLKEARKLFPWCAYPDPGARHTRPCFATHLGLCSGICLRAITLEEYQRTFAYLKRFLDGDAREALRTLRTQMETLSTTQQYERAARVRDAIQAIERSLVPQNVVTPHRDSVDAIGISRHGAHAMIAVLEVRHGRVVGTPIFPLRSPSDRDPLLAQDHSAREPIPAMLRGFLLEYYQRVHGEAREVLLPESIEDAATIATWIARTHGVRLAITTARRGWKRKLLSLAAANATEALTKSLTELQSPANLHQALGDLAHLLSLPAPPARIEAYDISNIQGRLATASMVVFRQGKPAPNLYRRFHILAEGKSDDVRMMREVLSRRFARQTRAEERRVSAEWPLPDLILLDGGKGQLRAGVSVLHAAGIHCPIAALAKQEEAVYVTDRREPLRLPRTSPALYLLQRLRDEAHRFTLGYHRLLRKKRMTRSLLEEIPGVGDTTRKKLLREFGSLSTIAAASEDDLEKILKSRTRAAAIVTFLRAARGAP